MTPGAGAEPCDPHTPTPTIRPPLRVLELYCGIGGMAAALATMGTGGTAPRWSRRWTSTASRSASTPPTSRTRPACAPSTRSAPSELAARGADLWTMSPPCQPYTRRGKGRDLDDPRAASFANLLARLPAVRPRWLWLENVPGFAGSRAHAALLRALDDAGYARAETLLCPSELGWPNRRRRFYLVAARGDAGACSPSPNPPAPPAERPPRRLRRRTPARRRRRSPSSRAGRALRRGAVDRRRRRSGSRHRLLHLRLRPLAGAQRLVSRPGGGPAAPLPSARGARPARLPRRLHAPRRAARRQRLAAGRQQPVAARRAPRPRRPAAAGRSAPPGKRDRLGPWPIGSFVVTGTSVPRRGRCAHPRCSASTRCRSGCFATVPTAARSPPPRAPPTSRRWCRSSAAAAVR